MYLTSYLSCFVRRMEVDAHVKGKTEQCAKLTIKNNLKFYAKEHNRGVGVLCFSVTEKEKNYLNWLQAASKFKGAGCTASKTKCNEGVYLCYFVTIPVEENV